MTGTTGETAPLSGIRVCMFDAYGTLLDIAAAAARCGEVLGDKGPALTAAWRTKQTGYSWLLSNMGIYRDFWRITEDTLDVALAEIGVQSEMIRARLLAQYKVLDPHPDVPKVLRALKARDLPIAVLSNGTPEMLEGAFREAKLRSLIDHMISVDPIQIYKPNPRVYRHGADVVGVPPQDIAFVSANYWDVSGAATFGYRVVWLNRAGGRPEPLPGKPVATIRSMAELPALIA